MKNKSAKIPFSSFNLPRNSKTDFHKEKRERKNRVRAENVRTGVALSRRKLSCIICESGTGVPAVISQLRNENATSRFHGAIGGYRAMKYACPF